MTPRLKFLLSILAVLVIFAAAIVLFRAFTSIPTPAPIIAIDDRSPQIPPPPKISFVQSSSSVIVSWQDLPAGTTGLNIFRSRNRAAKGDLWQTLEISGPSGSAEIGGAGGGFFYYTEAVNGDGGSVWNFPSTLAEPPPPSGGDSESGSPSQNAGGEEAPAGTEAGGGGESPSDPGSGTSAPVSSDPEDGTPGDTTTYYSPDGQSSTTVPNSPQANFGAQHQNGRIHLWWYDLPAETDSFIIYRSANGSGPWTQLLQQTSPRRTDEVAILDLTVNQNQYYRMEVFSNSLVIANYGPVLLPGLQ